MDVWSSEKVRERCSRRWSSIGLPFYLSFKSSFYFYTVYADVFTFFLIDIPPVKKLINIFNQFYQFFGLKANNGKCEIAGIGSLKGLTEVGCGLKSVDLSNDPIKLLGIHFSYNKKVQMQNNFYHYK